MLAYDKSASSPRQKVSNAGLTRPEKHLCRLMHIYTNLKKKQPFFVYFHFLIWENNNDVEKGAQEALASIFKFLSK